VNVIGFCPLLTIEREKTREQTNGITDYIVLTDVDLVQVDELDGGVVGGTQSAISSLLLVLRKTCACSWLFRLNEFMLGIPSTSSQ
jgi:hypothetical protein